MQFMKSVHSRKFDGRKTKSRMKRLFIASLSLTTLLGSGLPMANAETVPMDFPRLAQVGPIHADNGYPVWYEDSQGTRLQLCINADDPLCAMVPEEIPDPSQPISLKAGNFPGEAFYQLAASSVNLPNGGSAEGTFALEAAFQNGAAIDGEQIVFGRIRLRVAGLMANETYTITHPYGIEILQADGTGTINFTEDIGIDEGFPSGALQSRIGTFLQWDTGAPAGYIGNPEVNHKIIGGINNQNFFRIEGQGIGTGSCGQNCAQTDLFSLMGKKATIADVKIAAPAVNEVTDRAAVVSGTAEAGTTVEVKSGTTLLGTGTAAETGSFSVTIPVQSGGTILSITAKGSTGNISREVIVTVKDTTAPAVPVVNEVTDQAAAVTGTAEAGSTVEVKSGPTVLGTATAAQNGSFSVTIPVQSAGTTLSITAKDASGNVSEAAQVTVVDITPPAVPVVNEVTDQAAAVTGTAEAGSTVEVKSGSTSLGTATAAQNGLYSVLIPVQSAGTILSITAKDASGNVSEAVQVTVLDRTAPAVPVVNEVTDQATPVTGQAEAGSKVDVKAQDGTVIGTATSGADGSFTVTIPVQVSGTELSVTATDNAGNTSVAATLVVKDVTAPAKPVVNAVNNKSASVTGQAEAGSKVDVKAADGTVIGTATAGADGKFTVTIPVQVSGTELSVTATDTAGNTSEATPVTVQPTGWVFKDGKWYYYDPVTSVLKTGWYKVGSTWYYSNANGIMQTGWLNWNKQWYYLKTSGAMATGWLQVGKVWYYFHGSGVMATGWVQSGKNWYYMRDSGAMATGWVSYRNNWYYMDSNGAMVTGWRTISGKRYFFNSNGTLR